MIEYEAGDNNLTANELALAAALDAKGRTDLGACVRGSRLHQYLRVVVACADIDLNFIFGLHEAMGYGKVPFERRSRAALLDLLSVKYEVDSYGSKQELYDKVCSMRV